MNLESCIALAVWAVSFVSTFEAAAIGSYNATQVCHYLPSDPEWPTDQEWAQLNASVNGRLITASPLAEVCYGFDSDSAACARIRDSWTLTQPQ